MRLCSFFDLLFIQPSRRDGQEVEAEVFSPAEVRGSEHGDLGSGQFHCCRRGFFVHVFDPLAGVYG